MEYKMIDLGLPSGLKWADRNVGAESPQDYGDYFMWGSVTPDTDNVCDWEHAPFNNGCKDFDEEYFNSHKSEWLTDEGVLKPEYDVAHTAMGGSWRMPTSAEMKELIDGTYHKSGTVEGVLGMLFISKKDTTKRMFIPFCGYRDDFSTYGAGRFCFSWSSSLDTSYTYFSRHLDFSSEEVAYVYNYYRYLGLTVRGVHD